VTEPVASSWDAEYQSGRYAGAPPDEFVADIIAAAAAHGLSTGLYIGCGNGRNLVPLLDAGLDLTGLDISREALTQLRARRPDRAGPKTGLDIHFFSAAELASLVPRSFTQVLPLRRHTTQRHPPTQGQWSQWEVIWCYP
jgi:methyltransferase family protein